MNESEKENNVQARSLDNKIIFASSDFTAFEKVPKEEAASIVACCNFKIFMKLEDPQSTYDLFEKSVGEALESNAVILDADKKL